ncbi:hypothetical protein [Fibrobacter sp. UWEL]|uniref:hypothetical protein n=1 Tax=Fibrobacter sp. UWEL TaxID=1896209 RepID=UPI000918957F|nr:hypothetical protein [Fibrobacter sp. UWEL]SHL19426.1 hypothetical protein SAMN05720468_11649 [Fibrobacter sp. UWEL]
MKKLMVYLSLLSLVLIGCGGTKSDDPEALDNALVAFTSCVQGARWQEALEYVTPDEADEIGTSDGYEFKEEYMLAARRLPLSVLRKQGLEVDGKGRLVGIKAAMDEANERNKMSADQAKVGTNLKQMEDERIKRRIEQGQKILQEEEAAANQEQEEIVFSNKLTDEEKRKYGSTRDLQAPEELSETDEAVREAQEAFDGGAVGGEDEE